MTHRNRQAPADRAYRYWIRQGVWQFKLCLVLFRAADASIYIIPYAKKGEYYFGSHSWPTQEETLTFPFRGQRIADTNPKLSIHEQGQMHIKTDQKNIAETQIRGITELRGEQVAFIQVDDLNALPSNPLTARSHDGATDRFILLDSDHTSIIFSVHVNSTERKFTLKCSEVVRLRRSHLAMPVFVGITAIRHSPINLKGGPPGVTLIAGYSAAIPTSHSRKFLHLRAV